MTARRNGFTLIELLVVIAIVVTLFGLSLGMLLKRDDKEANVKAAADELASVLRATRTRAMEKYATYAVVFNLQNAPGSSGKVLNNRSGGHWYRVLGPGQTAPTALTFPPIFQRLVCTLNGFWLSPHVLNDDNPIRYHLMAVERSWEGDRHPLPAGKVRFVALTDQDNGDFAQAPPPSGSPKMQYATTYPRPWFGWWDASTRQLRTWGGYDPSIQGVRTLLGSGNKPSFTGFYYEGDDGQVSGCRNQQDRMVREDTNGDFKLSRGVDDPAVRYALWKQGEPRALINAEWQDFMIIFRPDGTVVTDWMRLRHQYGTMMGWTVDAGRNLPSATSPNCTEVGVADRCNFADVGNEQALTTYAAEATSYANRSGFHFITLGPDMGLDTDTYGSPETALWAMMPLYRVGISPFGAVKVVKVVNRDRANRPLDATVSGNAWNVKATTDTYYRNHQLTNADGTPRGMPVSDIVTAEMMRDRKWWWAP